MDEEAVVLAGFWKARKTGIKIYNITRITSEKKQEFPKNIIFIYWLPGYDCVDLQLFTRWNIYWPYIREAYVGQEGNSQTQTPRTWAGSNGKEYVRFVYCHLTVA